MVEAACAAGGDYIFWDEPHLWIASWEGRKEDNNVYSVGSRYAQELWKKRHKKPLPKKHTAEVDEFRETPAPVYIRATLYVERESQKGIVIGKQGATLKKIGAHARQRLETLLGEKVYLETWVKVLPKWRRSPTALTRFGFPIPDPEIR